MQDHTPHPALALIAAMLMLLASATASASQPERDGDPIRITSATSDELRRVPDPGESARTPKSKKSSPEAYEHAGFTTPLQPRQRIIGITRPVPLTVHPAGPAGSRYEIQLFEPGSRNPFERAVVLPGDVDLASMFPVLWTRQAPSLVFAQLSVDGQQVGAPIVLQPLLTPIRAMDGLTQSVRDAISDSEGELLQRLYGSSEHARRVLRESVLLADDRSQVFSGLRLSVARHLVLNTNAGEIEIRMRYDAAPNTSEHILELTEDGLYRDVIFHRIVREDRNGRPFLIQTGDPTGRGSGGAGFSIDYEASPVPHEFGVVSLARQLDDPNSGSSQFFICLSREACAPLDGQFTSFGHVVRGGDTLETIAAVPVGPRDPNDPNSPYDRPLDPPVILDAWTVPAPPMNQTPRPVKIPDLSPVER